MPEIAAADALPVDRPIKRKRAAQVLRSTSFISKKCTDLNFRQSQALLEKLLNGKIELLVITHKDRLLRFGAELIFSVCEMKGVEVVIINKGEETSFEEDLAKDVLEIITVFSARLYGSRSKKNQKLINGMKEAVKAAQ